MPSLLTPRAQAERESLYDEATMNVVLEQMAAEGLIMVTDGQIFII
jgi:hypothetical protein